MEHKYRLKYDLKTESGSFTKKELGNSGGTDALFIASVLYPADGSLSIAFFTKDGRTGNPMEDREMFKVWTLLAAQLEQSVKLHQWQHSFVSVMMASLRAAMNSSEKGGEK